MSSSETELLFWRVAVNTFTFLCVWYEDSFTQMKRSNAHEVTVHVFMSSFSETADASVWVVNKPARLRHTLTQRQAESIFKL